MGQESATVGLALLGGLAIIDRPVISAPGAKALRMSRVADPTAKISLLRAAESVFAERGLASAKVEKIARRAGVSKGAFYLHFASKEEAFEQVVESFLAHCGAQFSPPDAFRDLPDDPAEMLSFCLDHDVQLFEFLWQNRAIVAILQGCCGAHVYLMQSFNQEMVNKAKKWVELWKARRLFRQEIDTELTSSLITGAYSELSRKMLSCGTKPPIRAWLSEAQASVVRGFGTPKFIGGLQNRPVNQSIEPASLPRNKSGARNKRAAEKTFRQEAARAASAHRTER